MNDYKNEYFRLFNAITDAIEVLDKAAAALKQAQIAAEEAYISAAGPPEV